MAAYIASRAYPDGSKREARSALHPRITSRSRSPTALTRGGGQASFDGAGTLAFEMTRIARAELARSVTRTISGAVCSAKCRSFRWVIQRLYRE
jgi:hypothetical protein